jgi:replicative DNA helicase
MRDMPRALEAEKAILGMVLLDPDTVSTVLEVIEARDFYDSRHVVAMQAVSALARRGKPCDIVSVRRYLEDHELLDRAGGTLYLSQLMDAFVTTASLEHYLEIVKGKSVLRQLISAGALIGELGRDEKREPGELLDEAVRIISDPKNDLAGGNIASFADVIESYAGRFNGDKYVGQSCGFTMLDYQLFDVAGQGVIIGGMPHMGKTVFALNMLYRMAAQGMPVGVISLEMTNEAVAERFMQMSGRVSRRDLLTDEAKRRNAIKSVATLPIVYGTVKTPNLSNVLRTMRMMVNRHNVKMILVDYIQLIQLKAERYDIAVGNIAKDLMHFAQDHGVCVVVPSQINRGAMSEGPTKMRGKPQLWLLKDSGGIEAHMDVVLGVWRPSYVSEKSVQASEPFEVSILKNRGGLAGQRFDFTFHALQQRIVEDLRGAPDPIF